MDSVTSPEAFTQYPGGDVFARHVGTSFHASAEEFGAMELELTKVEMLSSSRLVSGGNSFSLMFFAAAGVSLPQGLYALEHADLGRLDVFLVPLGPEKSGPRMRYEAVFNLA